MTRNNTNSTRIPSVTDKPIQFSYDDFTSVDQRLKSYLELKFFRPEEECIIIFRVRFMIFKNFLFVY